MKIRRVARLKFVQSISDGAKLVKLVEAIADGALLDWDAIEADITDEGERRMLAQLKILARIAEVHRSQAGDPADHIIPTRSAKIIPMKPVLMVDESSARVIEKATDAVPERRYATAGEMQSDLAQAVGIGQLDLSNATAWPHPKVPAAAGGGGAGWLRKCPKVVVGALRCLRRRPR